MVWNKKKYEKELAKEHFAVTTEERRRMVRDVNRYKCGGSVTAYTDSRWCKMVA